MEGGCGFYLNYMLSNHDKKIKEDILFDAGVQARKELEKCGKNWNQAFEFLLYYNLISTVESNCLKNLL